MGLPKLETPTYKMKVPSTGQSITFRPFLVKEEKLLLMLGEGASQKERFDMVKELITACVQNELNFSTLTTFDVEYIFIQLRSKSVGQDVNLVLKCKECNEKCPVTIDLDKDISIENLKAKTQGKFTIPITNTVGITLKYPSFDELSESTGEADESDTRKILVKCVDTIYDDKTVYNPSDYTEKELEDFLGNLSMKELIKIKEFFDGMPKVKCALDFKCPKCNKVNKSNIDGIMNFF